MQAGESELSAICTFNVPVPRPSEPLNPRVSEVTGNSFFMRWGPPRNVRSVLMGGYVVELCVLKEGMSAETTTAEDWCIIYYDEVQPLFPSRSNTSPHSAIIQQHIHRITWGRNSFPKSDAQKLWEGSARQTPDVD